jgi:probable HAF family extracellular repeat protein
MKRTGVLLLALFTWLALSAWGQNPTIQGQGTTNLAGNLKANPAAQHILFEDNFNTGMWKPQWQSKMCCQWVQDGWLYTQETAGWPRDSMAVVHDGDQNWKDYTLSLKAQFVQTPDYYDVNDFTILVRTVNFVRSSEQNSGRAYQIIFNGKGYDWTPNQVVLIRSDYDIGSDTTLVTQDFPLSLDPMNLTITVKGPRIQLWIDGKIVFDVTDPDPFLYGGVGVHAIWETEARFDNLVVSTPAHKDHIKVWDLGAYPGGSSSWAHDINDFGVAAGWSDLSGNTQQHAVMIPLFGPNAMQWIDLGTFGGEESEQANSVSDSGIIVGRSVTSAGYEHAFVWTSQTGIVDLGTLANLGHTRSQANEVNRNGTLIVGWSASPDWSDMQPVVWTPSFKRTQHGLVTTWKIHQLHATALGQYAGGVANAVNNLGQIVGNVWGDFTAAVVWTPVWGREGWKPVPLFGSAEYPNVSGTDDINDRGEVVGTSCTPDWSICGPALGQPVGRANKTYKFTQLPYPSGLSNGGWAAGINNRGDIVGVLLDESGNAHAVLWSTKDPTFVELMPFADRVWSMLANVNEFGIAAGGYGEVDFMHGVAVQLH